jgi:hypothetical protein
MVNFVEVDFAISPATFISNQTVCVDQEYRADSCVTEVIPESFTIHCVCSVFNADKVALITDTSRLQGPVVAEFEQIRIAEMNLEVENRSHHVFQYIATSWMSFLFVTGLLASLIASQMDKNDQTRSQENEKRFHTSQFLSNVSFALDKPL